MPLTYRERIREFGPSTSSRPRACRTQGSPGHRSPRHPDMYRYDDHRPGRCVADRVERVPRPGRAPPRRRDHRGPVQAAAADERPLSAAARLHAAHRHPLRHADADAAAQAGLHRAHLRQGLRPLHHAPNLQFHWIKLEDAPDILDDLAEVEMHAIQTSGNCIRNVTADPYAGAAADEIDDPRVWCRGDPPVVDACTRNSPSCRASSRSRSPRRAEGPRGRRGSTTSACAMRRATRRRARLRGDGRRRPGPHALSSARRSASSCRRAHLLSLPARRSCASTTATAAATTSTRRASRSWSHALGARGVRPPGRGRVGQDPTARRSTCPTPSSPASAADFAPPAFETLPAARRRSRRPRRADPAFARLARHNVAAAQGAGLRHRRRLAEAARRDARRHAPPSRWTLVADLAERYSFDEIRVTHEQNLVLPHVKLDDLPAVYAGAGEAGPGDAEHRPGQRHHRLPGPGLLRAGQRPLDPDRAAASPSASPTRTRPSTIGELKIKISRLHQRLRPPPRRPHRHPGRR